MSINFDEVDKIIYSVHEFEHSERPTALKDIIDFILREYQAACLVSKMSQVPQTKCQYTVHKPINMDYIKQLIL